MLFLGHPTYAITVVLTGLLAFAGLGALLSGRVGGGGAVTRRHLVRVMVAVVALVVLETVIVTWWIPSLLGLPVAVRIAIVLAMMAPLGIALGMPFPLGVRVVDAWQPELIPWGWAINGFVSVFSSIFCIVLAMMSGFATVLGIGAVIYALGHWALLPLAGREEPP